MKKTCRPSRSSGYRILYRVSKALKGRPRWGVFWGDTLVEGGFRDRGWAAISMEWYEMVYPKGPDVCD